MADTWHLPDHEDWLGEPGYNTRVAAALGCAHQRLHSTPDTTGAYLEALDCLRPVLDEEMSARQRAHVLFLVALALATQDKPTAALEPIDEALELTIELDEPTGQMDLLVLRASVNRAISQVPDAVEDMRDYLALFADHEDQGDASALDPQMRLDAILHLAGSEWVLGHHESCEQLLSHAAHLLPKTPGSDLQVGLLSWTWALLYRWRGDLGQALIEGMSAADIYARDGAPNMASRIQGVVAEIAMDLAERFRERRQSQASEVCLTVAQSYSGRAVDLAGSDETDASRLMAEITHVRLDRLRGTPGDRTSRLKELATLGNVRRDVAIEAQAYTELGRECEASGDPQAATSWYRRAMDIVNEHQLVALATWAQRALYRLAGETQASESSNANAEA